MSEEVLNDLFELRNLEDDKARKYTLYRKIEKYIINLQQENKQLKEELEEKNKMYWQQQCAYYSSILYSLEEWLNENESFDDYCNETTFTSVLDKIQKLKEKYKC